MWWASFVQHLIGGSRCASVDGYSVTKTMVYEAPPFTFDSKLTPTAVASLYQSLRFIPTGHKVPLNHSNPEKRAVEKKASPYQIFFNLYKPSTPFKKSAPQQPDFQIVVIKYGFLPGFEDFF